MKTIINLFSLIILLVASTSLASCQSQLNAGIESGGITYLNASQFAEKAVKGKGIILDVRTPGEYFSGHISQAVNMDYYASDFESKLQKLDPGKEYYLYCASGNRSAKAAKILADKGFKKVYSLKNSGYSELRNFLN